MENVLDMAYKRYEKVFLMIEILMLTNLCLQYIEATWKHSNQDFECKKVNVATVIRNIIQLGTKKATGYDKIPTQLVKTAAKEIAPSLTSIFNQCIDESIFPDDFKFADITPAFKANNPLDKNNYRPITILSVLSKALEGIMNDQLSDYFNQFFHMKRLKNME